ncbi:MAG: RecX family transcriptional regulator [Lachnospiraceae bacterium]|nr:RecX family transcriptional regulator [Lachnospiraceae bacterium]
MFVESITAINRNKRRVCLSQAADPAFSSFPLRNADILAFSLREGGEVSPEIWEEICLTLRKDCLSKSADLLKSQDYTVARLKKKLREASFPAPVIDEAVAEMEEAGYLDDRRYAESFLRAHMGDRSFLKLRQDLKDRGVSGAVIEEAFAGAEDEGILSNQEEEQIRKILSKKGFDKETADWEEKQKMMAALYRRGFSSETIRRVLGETE